MRLKGLKGLMRFMRLNGLMRLKIYSFYNPQSDIRNPTSDIRHPTFLWCQNYKNFLKVGVGVKYTHSGFAFSAFLFAKYTKELPT